MADEPPVDVPGVPRECTRCNLLRLSVDEANRAARVGRAAGRKVKAFSCPYGSGWHVAPVRKPDPLTGAYRLPSHD